MKTIEDLVTEVIPAGSRIFGRGSPWRGELIRKDIKILGLGESIREGDFYFELDKVIYEGTNGAPYTTEGMIVFSDWCDDNNVYYYAECEENFFMTNAILEANAAGADYIYAEIM